jgi:hypothetical protein
MVMTMAILAYFRKSGGHAKFTINRDEKWGGPITYTSFADIERDFANDNVAPVLLGLRELTAPS